jgi:hypothetical protein
MLNGKKNVEEHRKFADVERWLREVWGGCCEADVG